MFRPFRNISSMSSRLPFQLERRLQQGESINVAKTRWGKLPWKTRAKKVFINGVAIYVAYEVFWMFMNPTLNKLEPPTKEEMEEEHEPLFIPVLGTAKLLPPVPYSGSDPEWKAFVKFGRDKEAAKRVRDELAAHVLQVAKQLPALSKDGKDMKLRRAWLDIDFPHSAPPEYERKGIEIDDDGINIIARWTTRKVEANTISKIQSVLYPKAVLQSAWMFIKVAAADELAKAANFLGLESRPPPPTLAEFLAKHQQLQNRPQIPSASGPALQPVVGAKSIGSASGDSNGKPALGQMRDELEMGIFGFEKQHALDLTAYFYRPILAMKQKLMKSWKPAPAFGPKGSFIVSGLVEIETTRLWVVFDVMAFYDPTEKTWDEKSMRLLPRRLQQKKQGPRGRAAAPPLPAEPPIAGKPY